MTVSVSSGSQDYNSFAVIRPEPVLGCLSVACPKDWRVLTNKAIVHEHFKTRGQRVCINAHHLPIVVSAERLVNGVLTSLTLDAATLGHYIE